MRVIDPVVPREPGGILRDAAGLPLAIGTAVVLRGKVTTLWHDLPRCNVIVEVEPGEKEAERRPSEFALHAHRLRTEMTIGQWRTADARWRDEWEAEANAIGLRAEEERAVRHFLERLVVRMTSDAILLARPGA